MNKKKRLISFLMAFLMLLSNQTIVFASTTDGKGDWNYTNEIITAFGKGEEFVGPVDQSKAQMFYGNSRDDVTESNLIHKTIGHFQIKNITTGKSISSKSNPQAEAPDTNEIGIPVLVANVGDEIEITDLSTPSGYTRSPNSNTNKRYNLQTGFGAKITSSQVPNIKTTDSGGYLPVTTFTITEEMVGDTTFYYKTADWEKNVVDGGVYNPYSGDGEGRDSAGYVNWSENGNHWAFNENTHGESFPGGAYNYFEALTLSVTDKEDPPPTDPPTDPPTEPDDPTEFTVSKIDADTNEPLAGATFRVSLEGSYQSWDITTDSSGLAKLENIPLGTYRVEEINPPAGYELSLNPVQHITLKAGQEPQTIVFANHKKTTIIIKKYDEDTGDLLPNAEFSISKKGGEIVYEGMTDSNGKIVVDGLETGWYDIEELAAPKGYLKRWEKKEVFLEKGKTVEVKFDNRRMPTLEILKIDEATGEPLAGAKFKVIETEGDTVSEYVTDSDGKITITDLEEKIYTVEEIVAPDGYLLDTQHKDIQLEWGKVKELVFTNKKKPTLEILKVDNQTKEPLPGAIFHVQMTEDGTVSEFITDEDGKITIHALDDTIYSVTEVVAPDGYLIDHVCHKDIKLEWGKTTELVFTNTKRPTLTILKRDEKTKEPLEGFGFKLTKTEDKTESEYYTDENGQIFIENLDEAVYTVEEIFAKDNYILVPNKKEIALVGGKDKELIYENTLKPTLIITKINALTQKGVPNTTYKIAFEHSNGGIENLGTFKTDKNGQIIIPYVGVGWYIITETIPAQGMQLPSNPITRVYLSAGENTYNLLNGGWTGNEQNKPEQPNGGDMGNGILPPTESDELQVYSGWDFLSNDGEIIENFPLNSLVIKKTDAVTSEMLEGATFEVRKIDGQLSGTSGTIIGRYTTDNSGIIVITGLEAGQYIVEEVKPPTNYMLSENSKQTTNLKADGTSAVEVTFTNYPYGSLLLTKVDSKDNSPLKNAKFKVTDSTGAVVGSGNGEYMTDENGEILITGLKPDSYIITEIQAPDGYNLDDEPKTIHINTDGKTHNLRFTNTRKSGVQIIKVDAETNEPLKGVHFRIYKQNGEVVGDYITDKDGLIIVDGLDNGWYKATETKGLDGYVRDDIPMDFEIVGGQFVKLTFENKPLSSLLILKTDANTGNPLAGVRFEVKKANGEQVGIYETDDKGRIYVNNLESGSYVVTETKPLDGYEENNKAYTVEINKGKQTILEVKNIPLSSLLIIKTDMTTKKPLAGVMFELTKPNGEIIGEYETDRNGRIHINHLEAGKYIVTEMQALDGYELDTRAYDVTVRDGEQTVLRVENKPLAGLRVKKIDSITKEGIYNVEFMVFDHRNKVVGTFYTDNNGVIDFSAILVEGRYTIRETRPAKGYYADDVPRTVEFIAGKMTEIIWENVRAKRFK